MARLKVFLLAVLVAAATLAVSVAAAANAPADVAKGGAEDFVKDRIFDALGTVGKVVGTIDDLAIDPIVEYFTSTDEPSTPSDEQLDAWFLKFMEGLFRVGFPEYGVTLDAGRIIIGGAAVAFNEFWRSVYEGGRTAAAERHVFGGNLPVDVFLGNVDRLLRDHSFFGVYLPRRSPRITPENIGQLVRSEEALKRLWFQDYAAYLRSSVFSLPSLRGDAENALDRGWPHLLKYWQALRAAEMVERLNASFRRELRSVPALGKTRKEQALAALKCAAPNSQPVWNESEQRAVCACAQSYVWNADRSACMLEPAAQVAAIRCQPGAEPFWSAEGEQVLCRCKPAHVWNKDRTECTMEPAAQVAATRCQPNAEPFWSAELQQVRCRCVAGHIWNAGQTACISGHQDKLAALNCPKYYPNTRPYWNEEQGRGVCICENGYRWNEKRDACVADPKAQVALLDCRRYPNSEAYWDEASRGARCRCLAGYRLSDDRKACVRREREQGPAPATPQDAESDPMAAVVQALGAAVAGSLGLPVPPATGGVPPGQPADANRPPPPADSRATTGPGSIPAASDATYFAIVSSAFRPSDDEWRLPECRFRAVLKTETNYASRREIEQGASAIRSAGYADAEVRYFDSRPALDRFTQEWTRKTIPIGRKCNEAIERSRNKPAVSRPRTREEQNFDEIYKRLRR